MQSKVRRPLYEGMQRIHALWFDNELIGETAVRQRVLAHWTPGSRLHRVHGGMLLLLGVPRPAHCAHIDGLPLCEENGVLSSAPLAPDEQDATPPACVWLVHGAQAQLVSLISAPRIDPSTWLGLEALPLAVPLQPPRAGAQPPPPDQPMPLRAVFGDRIPPASPRREAMLTQMAQAKKARGFAAEAAQSAAVAIGLIGLLTGASIGLVGLGFSLLGLRGKASSGSTQQHRAAPAQQRNPRGLSPLAQRLSAFAARMAMLTGASKVIGWRQTLYLRKMLQLLDQGDMQEALRHAIPLDAGRPADRPAFGAPRPRSSLEIGLQREVSIGIGLDPRLQEHLRATYRRTFERLEREGKVDEAAYVLAELLKCHAEAVDYLERKQRLQQAAQLAETLELPAETAVRLWYLAGNTKRAMHLARLTQAFSAVVQLAENRNDQQAATLRLWWAQDLAQRGALCEAAEAIWPLAGQRQQALAWLLEAERAGGMLSLRALMRKLSLMPDSMAASEPQLLQLLDDDGVHGAQRRSQLAAELLLLPSHSPATQRIASELLRPLLVERLAGRNRIDKQTINKLLDLGGCAMLRADLPQLRLDTAPAPISLSALAMPLKFHMDERGLAAIHDARRLPDGDYLLALGEGGVLRIDRNRRHVTQFPVPATKLVLADGGQRVLALVQRNAMWRVSRIDLIKRKVSDWIVQPLRLWAPQYDGLLWNVVIDNRLLALDTSKDQLAVSWQVTDLPGRVIALCDDGRLQTMLLDAAGELQQWRYQLPSRRLIQRDSFPYPQGVAALLPHGVRDVPLALHADHTTLTVRLGEGTAPVNIALQGLGDEWHAAISGDMLLVQECLSDGSLLSHAFDLRTSRVIAQLTLSSPVAPQLVVADRHLMLFDQTGRLVDINCDDSALHALTI